MGEGTAQTGKEPPACFSPFVPIITIITIFFHNLVTDIFLTIFGLSGTIIK